MTFGKHQKASDLPHNQKSEGKDLCGSLGGFKIPMTMIRDPWLSTV